MVSTNSSARLGCAFPEGERRQNERYACDLQTSCQVPFDRRHQPRWPARIRDISTDGLSLLLERWFGPGTLLELDLRNAAAEAAGTYLVRVHHATCEGNGRWHIGAAFLSRLSIEDLKSIL